tara:strand:+ start:2612 stop:2728 length:117 start_codon:yes stop_codon:yes gene_type:complete
MYKGTPTIRMMLYDMQTRVQTRRELLPSQELLHPVPDE